MLPTFQIVPASGELEEARIFNVWARLALSTEEATDFRAELQALLGRYATPSATQTKPYLLHLGLVEQVPK